MEKNWFLWGFGIAVVAATIVQSANARLQSNRSQQPPVDEEFEGQYKSVKGGVGAAFTEGENWDGLKTQNKMLPPDFKTEGMPGVAKEVDSFENRMQKEAKDTSDKSAAMRLPTQVHNFHDASSSSLEEEKQWEHMQQSEAGSSSSSGVPIPPPKDSAVEAKALPKGDKILRKN